MQKVTIYAFSGGPGDTERLLPLAAEAWAEEIGLFLPSLRLERMERGKPFFPEAPGLCCSVTHSGDWWLCALSDRPVGLDLQDHRQVNASRLARRFFLPEEAAYLARQPGDFFRLWTGKESYAKLIGTGLAGHFRDFSLVRDGALPGEAGGYIFRYPLFQAGYTLCLCTMEEAEFCLLFPEE